MMRRAQNRLAGRPTVGSPCPHRSHFENEPQGALM